MSIPDPTVPQNNVASQIPSASTHIFHYCVFDRSRRGGECKDSQIYQFLPILVSKVYFQKFILEAKASLEVTFSLRNSVTFFQKYLLNTFTAHLSFKPLSVISQAYLRRILGKSLANLKLISGKSQTNLRKISDKSQAYLRFKSGIS